eukprot:gene14300-biopygen8085
MPGLTNVAENAVLAQEMTCSYDSQTSKRGATKGFPDPCQGNSPCLRASYATRALHRGEGGADLRQRRRRRRARQAPRRRRGRGSARRGTQ